LQYTELEHISAKFPTLPELLLRFIEQAAQAVTVVFGSWEVPAWNLDWVTNYPD
jgi:ATP/maltotriose-dependent transcriptional regulator MalT